MARTDLHVHSKYSSHPTEWFLKRLGAAESYTEPEYIYATAKSRGMDFVTITDHNAIEGALRLRETHPEDTFLGVESTAYFPEDRCKIHMLIYGFTERQFGEIQELRQDIYDLRNYLLANALPHAVAHATYSLQGILGPEHIEKLVGLFRMFETVNGGRNSRANNDLESLLKELTFKDISKLCSKHRIQPDVAPGTGIGFTGGSDDHAGLFIGKTFTEADASNPAEFLDMIRLGRTTPGGRYHDFSTMAFSVFKIAYEFAKSRKSSIGRAPIKLFVDLAFGARKPYPFEDLALNLLGRRKTVKGKAVRRLYGAFVHDLRSLVDNDIEQRLEFLYRRVAALSDSLIHGLIANLKKSILSGKIDGAVRSLASSLPMVFLMVPFVTAFANMYNNRRLPAAVRKGLGRESKPNQKRILWFADTFDDLNGTPYTLFDIGHIADRRDLPIMFASSLDGKEKLDKLPPNLMRIPLVATVPISKHHNIELKIPSLLHALKSVHDYDPDEIYISTPAAIGLMGMFIAKLLKVKCVGVFHADIAEKAKKIINDESATRYLDDYMQWLYRGCDTVITDAIGFMNTLKERGFDTSNMKVLNSGVDTDGFLNGVINKEGIAALCSLA